MIRFGILSSLWTPTWMREGALAAVRGSAVHGLQVVEIALLEPDEVDAQHSLSLFDQYGVAPTATTAPVIPKPPRIDDAPGKTLWLHTAVKPPGERSRRERRQQLGRYERREAARRNAGERIGERPR